MARGWANLEAASNIIPDSAFTEGDPAFKFLNLSKTTRIYGFAGWCESSVIPIAKCPADVLHGCGACIAVR
jgi:hypothetical protein